MLALLDQIFVADEFRAGFPCGIGGGAFREDEDADDLSGAVREGAGAADHLIGLLGIDAEAEGESDRLVELGGGHLLRAEMASLSG